MGANVFLVRYTGGWAERTDEVSIAAYGRLEALLGLGALGLAESCRVADGQLADFSEPREQTDIQIDPANDDEKPYVGLVHIGDTVDVDGEDHRILGVTVTEDRDTGRVIYTPTLNDHVILGATERFAQALAKMVKGTMGGRSRVAQPVVPFYVARPHPEVVSPEWDRYDLATARKSAVFGSVNLWNDPTIRTGAVFGQTVSLYAPDDSLLPAGYDIWGRAWSFLKRTEPAPSVDVHVEAEIESIGPLGSIDTPATFNDCDFNLFARVALEGPFVGVAGWPGGDFQGWEATFYNYDGGGAVSFTYWVGDTTSYSTSDTNLAAALDVGDVVALEVSGSGAGTVVEVFVNGSSIAVLSGTDLTTFLDFGVGVDDLSLGTACGMGVLGSAAHKTAAGFTEAWDHGTMDGQITMTNFAASAI